MNKSISELDSANSINEDDILLISQKTARGYTSRKVSASIFKGDKGDKGDASVVSIEAKNFATKSALLADTTSINGSLAFVYNDTDESNGLYEKVNDTWQHQVWNPTNIGKNYTDLQLAKIVGTNNSGGIAVASTGTPQADWSGFSYGFAYPFNITTASIVNQIALKIGQNDTTNKTLKVTLRDSTVDGTVLATITKSSNVLFGTSTALTDVTLDFADLSVNANQIIYVVLEMLDASNQITIINTKTATSTYVGAKYRPERKDVWANIDQNELPLSGLLYKSQDKTVFSKLADTNASIATINDNFIEHDDIVASNAFNKNFWIDNRFIGWSVGVKLDKAVKPSVFAPVLFGLDKIYKLNLKVYQRPTADANVAPVQMSDNKILDKDYIVTDVLNPKVNDWSHFDFDISSIDTMQSDSVYVFVITAFDASNNRVSISAGKATVQNMQQYNLGWYEFSDNINIYQATADFGLAYNLYAKQQIAKNADNVLLQSVDATFNRYQQFSVNIPHLKINRTYNDIIINNQTVAIDVPQSTQISETITLKYSSHERALIGTALQYQYVRDVVVTEGSATLVQGVDYAIKPNTGRIYGLKNIADKSVNVSYKGYNHRYDLIVANRQSGAVSVIKGTERKIDPEHYQPTAGNAIELFLVYVTINGCELLPVYRYRNYMPLDYVEPFNAWLYWCKTNLTKTFGKLNKGQNITLMGYGDSITAQGDGWGDSALIAGGNRDRVYILERIPGDTIASQITLYDGTDKDFLGSTYNNHTKIGWNWHLKATLEQLFGVTVTYKNRGIGGSESSTTDGSANGGIYGGLNSTRLNAALSDNPDLVVLAFGMNELGSDQTYTNCRAIIEQFKSKGADVIVMTTPMPNKWGGAARKEDWLYTNDELVRCAIDTKSAYVSTYLLEHSDFAGNNRLSEQNMCNDNLYNHPTHYQLKHIGNMLSLIFKPT